MTTALAYKVLDSDCRSFHGGWGRWTPGRSRYVAATTPLVPCRSGIHYCQRGQLVQWLGPRIFMFEDETPDETINSGDKMVTRRGRIVEEVTAWNERTARLFAADCAEAALDAAIPETHREPFTAAISVARDFANGKATDAQRSAAGSAASAAAGSAARSAAAGWSAAGSAAGWSAAGSAAWAAARSAAESAAGSAAAGWSAAGSAAWAAAESATWTAARSAARSAAGWLAAGSAAGWSAAWAAARSATWSAARSAQTEMLFAYLEAEVPA